jgi:release factor glutamine methyltransferase
LKEVPNARGVGVDNNERALQVARENAKRHNVEDRAEFLLSHWCDAIDGTFDLILSNPPYIASDAMSSLMKDVADFEPKGALVAGIDGLDAYRAIVPQLSSRLNPGGYVLFEVGQGQAELVEALLQAQGLKTETAEKDLSGVTRCVIARRDNNNNEKD